jgi:hypothetical protein
MLHEGQEAGGGASEEEQQQQEEDRDGNGDNSGGESGSGVAVLHFCWTSDLLTKIVKMKATGQVRG